MKYRIATIATFAASLALAIETKIPVKMPMPERGSNGELLTPEQRADRARKFKEMRYRKTGGFLVRPGSQNGKIVFVNAQKEAPVEWIQEIAAGFTKETRFRVEVVDGEFSFPSPNIVGNASVFVIDNPNMPPVLNAPESRWSMINIAPLKTGAGQKPAFFRARCMKEFVRGFCFVGGTQDSNYPMALVGPVLKPDDLDQFADWRLPVDVYARIKKYSSAMGITPLEEVSYRKACQEGWAPEPTNDVQRAIWKKVHAVPDKPITIEFDPKKDK